MDSGFYLEDLDNPELWQAPLTPTHPPNAWSPLPDSLFPSASIESSPASPSMASPPTTSSSPQGPLEDIPATNGVNLEPLGPTASGRVQAKVLLLTWSQVPESFNHEAIRAHLASLGPVESLAVGLEAHADGGRHFHACAIYRQKIRCQPTAFALLGRTADVRIANSKRGPLQQCVVNYWTYALKEDPTPLVVGTPPTLKRSRTAAYTEAISIAVTENVERSMDFLSSTVPADLVLKGDQIQRNLTMWRNKKARTSHPARPLSEFTLPFILPEAWRVLFLWGMSGAGKTQLARALLPEATVVRHRNQLTDADFSKGVIFDDFDVSHWPPTAVIHLLDWDEQSGIDVKYGYAILPPHTRKIFTFNSEPIKWIPPTATPEQVTAIFRRMFIQPINGHLF